MARLEQLTSGVSVRGLVAGAVAKVVQVEWFGDQAVKVTFEEPTGTVSSNQPHMARPPVAAFVYPGHPLLDSTIDLALERHRELMKQGAVLVDPRDQGERVRFLVILDQAIQDGRHQVVARRLHFIELFEDGSLRDAGPAPYVDYRPARDAERAAIAPQLEDPWLAGDLESQVVRHAVQHLVPRGVDEVRARRLTQIAKVEREVQARLRREMNYWDHRAEVLKDQERAGKQPRMNPQRAAARAEELADRLQRRIAELTRERDISALPPVVLAGALVVPIGLLRKLGVMDGSDEAIAPEINPARHAEIENEAIRRMQKFGTAPVGQIDTPAPSVTKTSRPKNRTSRPKNRKVSRKKSAADASASLGASRQLAPPSKRRVSAAELEAPDASERFQCELAALGTEIGELERQLLVKRARYAAVTTALRKITPPGKAIHPPKLIPAAEAANRSLRRRKLVRKRPSSGAPPTP